eukprot:8782700-Pyramimonas_sp.AAC.1
MHRGTLAEALGVCAAWPPTSSTRSCSQDQEAHEAAHRKATAATAQDVGTTFERAPPSPAYRLHNGYAMARPSQESLQHQESLFQSNRSHTFVQGPCRR